MTDRLVLGRDLCDDLDASLRREWLVTNGLGGYASGTVAGAQTRRYHGLLIAARQPPVGRTATLVDLDVEADVDGRTYALACHEYADGTIAPAGHLLIESFELDGTVPTWRYALGSARLVRCVYMARGHNATYVVLHLERALGPVTLRVRPLCTGRDHHWHRRGGEGFTSEARGRGCVVYAGDGMPPLALHADAGAFRSAPDTYWNFRHRAEAARGLDSVEDLHCPGEFSVTLEPGARVVFTASIDDAAPAAEAALGGLRAHEAALLAGVGADAPAWIRRLALAADQFVATRRTGAGGAGATIVAGYPWFSDWGRDTMIALPGLTLATGRPALAASILRTYAESVDRGMLPNRFPDGGEPAEYNTVDATLWYFVAIHAYVRETGDLALARDLLPVLVDVVGWHRRGTRHGISVDPDDGLLRAGEPGVQLTWMDAKIGDWVVTPRTGKAVEINALWCNALAIVAELAALVEDKGASRTYAREAASARESFARRFWNGDAGYLYDVIDVPPDGGPDPTLRPNQLIALSLPHPLLPPDQASAVLTACERSLLTSVGLRTLPPDHPDYVPHYGGSPLQRDAAYHRGTVWPWLLGPFCRAHHAVHGDTARAMAYLAPLAQHLEAAGLGQIGEVFDADPPHAPGGCIAQAWSVAEPLAVWSALARASRDERASAARTPLRRSRSSR